MEDNKQINLYDDTDTIEQEINQIIESEYARSKNPDEPQYIKTIKNRHEGYGHAAEGFVAINNGAKRIKDDLKEFLAKLATGDDFIVKDAAGDIYIHAEQLTIAAIVLAAAAKRIIYDVLAVEGNEELPLEALLNSTETNDKDDENNIDYTEAEL